MGPTPLWTRVLIVLGALGLGALLSYFVRGGESWSDAVLRGLAFAGPLVLIFILWDAMRPRRGN
jgi:hypothetical protein